MSNLDCHIEQVLQELGLSGQDLISAKLQILAVRKELAMQLLDLDQKKLPRQLAIVNSPHAVETVDTITDKVAVLQGLLSRVMGHNKQKDQNTQQEIYDKMAIIKAKIESLVVEGEIQARTLNSITQQLRLIKTASEPDTNESKPDEPDTNGSKPNE